MKPEQLSPALKSLCAQYQPIKLENHEWFKEFVILNIETLFNMIFPGQQIRIAWSNTLYFNSQEHAWGAAIDYVPVCGTIAVFDNKPLGNQNWTHYFVIRPTVIETVATTVGFSLEEINLRALVWGWGAIGFALRRMLQRKYGEKLKEVPFGALGAFGVQMNTIMKYQAHSIFVSQNLGLDGYRRRSYLGCMTAAAQIDNHAEQAAGATPPEDMDFIGMIQMITIHTEHLPQ
ncbi:MAG: hypothetical protein K9M11_02375 [Candidatus Pacebacteria bacterium]|nr:hypothetical protein [Candidatus Paceibacterota bacterium]